MNNDYYGDGMKWFIGVVKDVVDPKNSNRVRVRIKGIHPDEGDEVVGGNVDGSGQSSGGNSSGGSSGTNPSAEGSPAGDGGGVAGGNVSSSGGPSQITVNKENLPSRNNFSGKLSPNWTLGQLTVGAHVTGGKARANAGQITPEIVERLAAVAQNILEPLKKQFPGVIITSGWRPKGKKDGPNHSRGAVVDLQVPGVSIATVRQWIVSNLKGRYSELEYAPRHIHIGIGTVRGSTSSPNVFSGPSR